MNQDVASLLYVLAGVNIAFAVVNLSIGLQKGSEKSYLFLGLIGAFISVYYLMFPYIEFTESLPLYTIFGFSFFISTFAILPWFFGAFTGFNKTPIQTLLSIGMAISLMILFVFPSFGPFALWNVIGHSSLVGIIVYGIYASRYQMKNGDKINGRVLCVGVILLALLTLDDINRMHFPQFYPFNFAKSFLPLDYFMVVFVMVMGIKMIFDIQQKYKLEKQNVNKEKRWRDLLSRVELFVVRLSNNGEILYSNPYFQKNTHYKEDELIGKNWFDIIINEQEKISLLQKHKEFILTKKHTHYQNAILNKEGEELQVFWSNLVMFDEEGNFISTLSIGADITKREQAFQEIELLKAKLEEENIQLKAEFKKGMNSEKILGNSDAIRYVLKRSLMVAPTTSTVLLEGETGVGKELIAIYSRNTEICICRRAQME